jgi:tRNA U55 pseudouridine synthase TruB
VPLTRSLQSSPPRRWEGFPPTSWHVGDALEPIAVPVEVSTFEVTSFSAPLVGFRVVCSSGTYVRSLAHDLGTAVWVWAHLDSLRRVRSGDFSVERAVPLERATAENIVRSKTSCPGFPGSRFEDELSENRVRHGNRFQRS